MKKILSLFLTILFCLSTCVCSFHASADTACNSANAIAYKQGSAPWNVYVYGKKAIGPTGCGILSSVNAIHYLNGIFDTIPKADEAVKAIADYAYAIDAYNGTVGGGTARERLFGTEISNPPPLVKKFGEVYHFKMLQNWTEKWNYENVFHNDPYFDDREYTNIYVKNQTKLKNYLAGDAVAIAHVPGHFVCLADYDPVTDRFLLLDCAPADKRHNTNKPIDWYTAEDLSGGWPSLTVGGYCVLQSTLPSAPVTYPYVDGKDVVLYDGDETVGISGAYHTTVSLDSIVKTSGDSSLSMTCTDPADDAENTKIGGMMMQKMDESVNLKNCTYLTYDLYLSRDMIGSNELCVDLGSDNFDGIQMRVPLDGYTVGWHKMIHKISDFTTMESSVDQSRINRMRMTWINGEDVTDDTVIKIDNVRASKFSYQYPYDNTVGTMLYDGESVSDVIPSYGTAVSLSNIVEEGSHSLKMDITDPSSYLEEKISGQVNIPVETFDLTNCKYIRLNLFLGQDMKGEHTFKIELFSENGERFYIERLISDRAQGWYRFSLQPKRFITTADAADWSKINNIRLSWINNAGLTTPHYFLVDNICVYRDNSSEVPTLDFSSPANLGDTFKSKLKVQNGMNVAIDRSDVVLAAEGKDETQYWEFVRQTDGSYTIENLSNGKFLTVADDRLSGEFFYGNLNDDDMINAVDALLVLQIAVGKYKPSSEQELLGDVNGDGNIDAVDALQVLQYSVGKLERFPVAVEASDVKQLASYDSSVMQQVSLPSYESEGQAEASLTDVCVADKNKSLKQKWFIYTCGTSVVLRPVGIENNVLEFETDNVREWLNVQIGIFANKDNQKFNIQPINDDLN